MKLLSFPELKSEKGIRYSKAWIYKLIKEGKFPAPIRIGENYVAWSEEVIDEHLTKLAAAANHEAA
jgi:prophage regulatory protein